MVSLVAFWYLDHEEHLRELATAQQNAETIQQQLRLRLVDNEVTLRNLGFELNQSPDSVQKFETLAPIFTAAHPEIIALYWHDLFTGKVYVYAASTDVIIPPEIERMVPPISRTDRSESSVIHGRTPKISSLFFYSVPTFNSNGTGILNASITIPGGRHAQAILTATYTLDRMLRNVVPSEITLHSTIWLEGRDNLVLASTNPSTHAGASRIRQAPRFGVTVMPVGKQLRLYVQGSRVQPTLAATMLFWFAACLCILIVTLLLLNWKHLRQRIKAQRAMQREANFRRAMENSMITGMRALDIQGRITYVNPAFCRMTGYSESEILGTVPPYAYWPQHNRKELFKTIEDELSGKPRINGYEVQLQRRNGELFYARLYVSPLVDQQEKQTGWITAITDISEAKRIREELTLAGKRFTTVLEALDSAISVVTVGSQELLFANQAYRNFFGNSAQGHLQLAGDAIRFAVADEFIEEYGNAEDFIGLPKEDLLNYSKKHSEIHVDSINRWLEVRSRYLPWVDGRLAQMLIATDITERHNAQEAAALELERIQEANRLMTMGEMVSSVAHELNQPLTAISNYCMGLLSRLKQNSLSQEDLIDALGKTAKQAMRAGLVIQRIRSFVKKNAPNRTVVAIEDIIENVRELAEIDAYRRHIALQVDMQANLPPLEVDPILIEQVILNLVRNATEAIEQAKRPMGSRRITIATKRSPAFENDKAIHFIVSDTGTGLSQQALDHLFDTFFTTKTNGLGIGLNLCQSIIESHGGALHIENIIDNGEVCGCRCIFWLPMAQGETVNDTSPPLNFFTDEAP